MSHLIALLRLEPLFQLIEIHVDTFQKFLDRLAGILLLRHVCLLDLQERAMWGFDDALRCTILSQEVVTYRT